MSKKLSAWVTGLMALLVLAGCSGRGPAATAGDKPADTAAKRPAIVDVILATTTSTQDSGLLDVLIPAFEQETGYKVKPIAVGTGQALKMGEEGNADVLLVHAPADEKKLVESGAAIERKLVMHNDFLVVGPAEDPAGIKGMKKTADALKRVAESQSIFISRGDDSGTHKKELSLWKVAGIEPRGTWYQETGSGMGQTLNVASEKRAYTMTDRATYLAQQKNLALEIMVEGDGPLLNIYHVMLVNPARFSKVNAEGARAFADFLLSAKGQEMIRNFGVEKYGQSLFIPDGGKTEEQLGG